jgi:copper chaperone CopZ
MRGTPSPGSKPWYAQFWPWVLIGLPAISVVFSVATLVVAIRNGDSLVRDDWYTRGLAINRDLGRAEAAVRLGVGATVNVDAARDELVVTLEGMRCGACVWLIEEALRRRPGVRDIAVNLASARAELAWEEGTTRLSELLAELARLGYQARPYRPDWEETARREEYHAALWRLGLSGLGAMQVMMYAVALYAGALEGMRDA